MNSLSWSPDGRSVAYQSNHEGPPNIYVMDMRNKDSRRFDKPSGQKPVPRLVTEWKMDRLCFRSSRRVSGRL